MIKALLQQEAQEFIRDHENDDPATLMLQAKKHVALPMREIVAQIVARQKAKYKIPFWYATDGLLFPPPLSLEQCSSELTAIYKQQLVAGNKMVDLTGGMGIDTYFLSQNFQKTEYVEQQEPLVKLAKHNFSVLGASSIKTHYTSADQFLEACDSDFDLIYIDPARRDLNQNKVFRLSDCEPDMVAVLPAILKRANVALIKVSPLLDIKGAIRDLGGVNAVHVVAVKG